MTFEITGTPIDAQALHARLKDSRAGALVTFEGWVRDSADGHAVVSLEYEAYGPLAVKEGQAILEEASRLHRVVDVICIHRTGHLSLGEMAVWVGVTAAHRAAAFEACRFVIDEVKARVPIWKKEHYADGESVWVNCATRSPGRSRTQADG